jgi:hypothetical protein
MSGMMVFFPVETILRGRAAESVRDFQSIARIFKWRMAGFRHVNSQPVMLQPELSGFRQRCNRGS